MSRPAQGTSVATISLFALATWFGLVTGLIEVADYGWRRVVLDGFTNRSPQVVWMAPAGYVATYLVLAAGLSGLARYSPRREPVLRTAGWFLFLLLSGLGAFYPYATRVSRMAFLILAIGLAVQLTRTAVRHTAAMARAIRASNGWLLGAVVALSLGVNGWTWWRERAGIAGLPAARTGIPNVLLIILDTVRASHMSVYGYARQTTPSLDAWAAHGTTFTRAISTAPWTLPSHASMFTGRLPHELTAGWHHPLEEGPSTLAEVFAANGYRTAGFVGNMGYVSREHGVARGFAHYDDFPVSAGQLVLNTNLLRVVANNFRLRRWLRNDEMLNRRSAEDITDAFLKWQGNGAGQPFFAFLNYYDAHGPYLPPGPFDRKFGTGRTNGKLSPLHRWNWDPAVHHEPPLTPTELREEIDAYDGALAYLDQDLGRLIEELNRRGALANTVVVVTADHGEEFGEHGLFDHGNSLYLPSVAVPLMISFPDHVPEGHRVTAPVSLRDLAATVLDVAGLRDGPRLPGESLARYWTGGDSSGSSTPSPLLSEVAHAPGNPAWFPVSKGDMQAVQQGDARFIRNGDGREELYDLAIDPAERKDMAAMNGSAAMLGKFRLDLVQLLKAESGSR